jgi:hypothetical protein
MRLIPSARSKLPKLFAITATERKIIVLRVRWFVEPLPIRN